MSGEVDARLARMKRLPPRLRVVHLAALLRSGRAVMREGSLSYPSPRERQRVVEARVGGILLDPHPAHRSPSLTMIHLESELARLGPRKGEGSNPSDGHHG